MTIHDPGPIPIAALLDDPQVPRELLEAALKTFFEAGEPDDRAEALADAVAAVLPVHEGIVRAKVAAEMRAAARQFHTTPATAVEGATLTWYANHLDAKTTLCAAAGRSPRRRRRTDQ